MYRFRKSIKGLVTKMDEHDRAHDTFTFVGDIIAQQGLPPTAELTPPAELPPPAEPLPQSAEPRATTTTTTAEPRATTTTGGRRPSLISAAADVSWLSEEIDTFSPLRWWAGSYIIGMRLLQTSAMALIASPNLQAAAATLVALAGACVQRDAAPYRRDSDNRAALVASWALFAWCFTLLVRYSGAVGDAHAVVLGVFLIGVTVATLGAVVYLLVMDVIEDGERIKKARDRRGASSSRDGAAAGEAQLEHGMEAGTSAAAEGGAALSTDSAGPPRPPAAPSDGWGLASSLFLCASPDERSAGAGEDAKQPKTLEDATAQIAKKDAALATKDAEFHAELAKKDAEIARKDSVIAALRR